MVWGGWNRKRRDVMRFTESVGVRDEDAKGLEGETEADDWLWRPLMGCQREGEGEEASGCEDAETRRVCVQGNFSWCLAPAVLLD